MPFYVYCYTFSLAIIDILQKFDPIMLVFVFCFYSLLFLFWQNCPTANREKSRF